MTERKQVRPGTYPTTYVCRYCEAVVKKKDIMTSRAKQLSETECVCATCIPRLKELESPPPERPTAHVNDDFVALVAAAEDNAALREQVLGLARLDSFNRRSMLSTIISESGLRGAPDGFTQALACLKDDDIAHRVIEFLM